MADGDAEIVRDQYAATNERDFERAMGHYADDVELVVPAGIRGGTFHGREAVGGWFGDWFSSFDRDARFEIRELIELPSGAIVVADHFARGRSSGAAVEGEFIWRYRLRDGKIVHVEGFDSREDALAAEG